MEIGPIRNQNLIFWPLTKCLDKGQQKINCPHQPTIKFTGFLLINYQSGSEPTTEEARHHIENIDGRGRKLIGRNLLNLVVGWCDKGQQKIKIIRTN